VPRGVAWDIGSVMGRAYPEGVDCVWLGCDRARYVGAFVTAGEGPISLVALNSVHLQVEDVEERIGSLPRVSDVHVLVVVKRPDDFIAMAERGLFVYDWTDVHRTRAEAIHAYELAARPVKPVSKDSIGDPEIVEAAAAAVLVRAAFSSQPILNVRDHLACEERG
jgi:hypothetical protein